jgi:hypothetical protein
VNSHEIDRRIFCLGTASILTGLGASALDDRSEIKLGAGTSLKGARIFPETDSWNQDISRLPTDPKSAVMIKNIGLDKPLHADFGSVYEGRPIGIPYTVVDGNQPKVSVRFEYAGESDPGPYPIPPDVTIEGDPKAPNAGDCHILIIDRDSWKLYELFAARRGPEGWSAGSGAIFDLKSNTKRPAGWTSADAAGLPIFPGLVRPDEVIDAGAIRHALRFTCQKIRRAYVAPASHYVNHDTSPLLIPMGARVRLKASFDTKPFPKQAKVILDALKVYGMILADIGSDWFVSGSPDPRWDNEALGTLRRVHGKDFEVVKMAKVVAG